MEAARNDVDRVRFMLNFSFLSSAGRVFYLHPMSKYAFWVDVTAITLSGAQRNRFDLGDIERI